MKKFALIWWLTCVLLFAGCSNNFLNNTELKDWESLYNNNLTVAGVWPEISMEPTVDEGTLVLIWNYEDHTDHIFLQSGSRESHFNTESEYLPWNTVNFVWIVEEFDWAAGNHYFDVKKVELLRLKDNPDVEEIKWIIDSYNYCESDDDCELIAWECPFGCRIAINKNFRDTIWDIIYNYFENAQWEKCVYSCVYAEKAVCENYKCEVKN